MNQADISINILMELLAESDRLLLAERDARVRLEEKIDTFSAAITALKDQPVPVSPSKKLDLNVTVTERDGVFIKTVRVIR